jgi:hypothetical protein
MLDAMARPDDPDVQRRLALGGGTETVEWTEDHVMRPGHNAPAGVNDPDAIEEFAGFVLEEELPDDMRGDVHVS